MAPVWIAEEADLQAGQARLRSYRLTARFLNRFDMTIWLSRTGEILKIDLPDQITLINEAVPGLTP